MFYQPCRVEDLPNGFSGIIDGLHRHGGIIGGKDGGVSGVKLVGYPQEPTA